MPNLTFAANVKVAASNSLLISGCARSGTTLVGKLIGSAKEVEYFFEPESLVGLYSVINSINSSVYQTLFTSMLVEHLCANSISGRILNFNPNDDSCIYTCKSESEIAPRLDKSWRREEIHDRILGVIPAFKIPSVLPRLPEYHFTCFPSSRVLCVVRDPCSIYRSMRVKKWFSERANVLFPFFDSHQSGSSLGIPYWVESRNLEEWLDMSDIQKFAYYYSLVYESALSAGSKFNIIDYSRFVLNPSKIAHSLFDSLGLSFGSKTRDVLDDVEARDPASVDFSPEEQLELNRLLPLYDALAKKSVS